MICTVTNQVDKDFGGFPVPLGLLKVNRSTVDSDLPGMLILTLAPGNYHGVMSTEMRQ